MYIDVIIFWKENLIWDKIKNILCWGICWRYLTKIVVPSSTYTNTPDSQYNLSFDDDDNDDSSGGGGSDSSGDNLRTKLSTINVLWSELKDKVPLVTSRLFTANNEILVCFQLIAQYLPF